MIPLLLALQALLWLAHFRLGRTPQPVWKTLTCSVAFAALLLWDFVKQRRTHWLVSDKGIVVYDGKRAPLELPWQQVLDVTISLLNIHVRYDKSESLLVALARYRQPDGGEIPLNWIPPKQGRALKAILQRYRNASLHPELTSR